MSPCASPAGQHQVAGVCPPELLLGAGALRRPPRRCPTRCRDRRGARRPPRRRHPSETRRPRWRSAGVGPLPGGTGDQTGCLAWGHSAGYVPVPAGRSAPTAKRLWTLAAVDSATRQAPVPLSRCCSLTAACPATGQRRAAGICGDRRCRPRRRRRRGSPRRRSAHGGDRADRRRWPRPAGPDDRGLRPTPRGTMRHHAPEMPLRRPRPSRRPRAAPASDP